MNVDLSWFVLKAQFNDWIEQFDPVLLCYIPRLAPQFGRFRWASVGVMLDDV